MHFLSTSTGMPTPFATLLLLIGAATTQATIAAWWTDLGPQVILQNDTTGQIRYSACNSRDQPQYSATDNSTFSLKYKPKKGTPLGGGGYVSNTKTVASIYYLDEDNNIINAVFNCRMTTGLFESAGSWIISNKMGPLPLSTNSGLAAFFLGSGTGYRVYYHDKNMAVNELGYNQAEGWQYKGVISQDPPQGSSVIAAAFSSSANISVVTARDAENIEVARYQKDGAWRITTFPHPLQGDFITMETAPDQIKINSTVQANFTLPAWKGKPGALGMSVDKNNTRSVWYIGEDSNLYWVASKNWVWSHQNGQTAEIWPVADSPNAPLAVAIDSSHDMLRIYYVSGGKLVEIKNDQGEWSKWSTLPAPQPVDVSPPASPSSPAVVDGSTGGLSNGMKIGLGVGISLAVLAIGAISAVLFLLRRKRSASSLGSEAGARIEPDAYGPINPFDSPSTQYSTHGVPPGSAGYDPYAWDQKINGDFVPPPNTAEIFQLDATGRPVELHSPQSRYELSDQPTCHELMGEGLVPVHRPYR